MLANKSLLFTVIASMTGIMADTGALVIARAGVVLTFQDGHTVGPDQIHFQTYQGDPTVDGASFKVNNGATCHIDGAWPLEEQTVWNFTTGPSFLQPCGPNNGAIMVCVDPEATCD